MPTIISKQGIKRAKSIGDVSSKELPLKVESVIGEESKRNKKTKSNKK